jgi:Zn-dependent alcohol dehydrogenase
MEHIQGFTRSHWMPPSGKCLRCIAPAAAMVNKFVETTQNTTTDYRTIEISDAWKRFMTFLVVNLFQASEIFLYCSYVTSCL